MIRTAPGSEAAVPVAAAGASRPTVLAVAPAGVGPGAILGAYRLTRELGAGGMGAVYAGEHTLLGRAAAIKVLRTTAAHPDDAVGRFFNEARAATAIRHPGIIEVFDFGYHDDGAPYLVMELLDGESLRERLRRGPLPPAEAVAVARQIAGALAAAHAKGIIHRDLKPDNVFLIADPEVPGGRRVKLLDFGIAKLLDVDHPGPHTATGMVLGTPTYMSPEQCRGAPLDPRADLYALGCLLFEMCAGVTPFTGAGPGELIAAHIHLAPPSVRTHRPGVSASLAALIDRLLAKSRSERPETAELVVALLDQVRDERAPDEEAPAKPAVPTIARAASTPRRVATAIVAAAAAVAVLVATLVARGGHDVEEVVAAPAPPALATPAPAAPSPWSPAPAPLASPVAPSPSSPRSTLAPSAAASPLPPAAASAAPPAAPPPAPAAASAPAPAPVALAPPAEIALDIRTQPPGAEVALDGVVQGRTPFVGRWAERDRIAVTVRMPGYRPVTRVVSGQTAVRLRLVLARKAPMRPRPPTTGDQSANPFAP